MLSSNTFKSILSKPVKNRTLNQLKTCWSELPFLVDTVTSTQPPLGKERLKPHPALGQEPGLFSLKVGQLLVNLLLKVGF